MEEKVMLLLKKEIGRTIRIGGALGDKEEKLGKIHIQNNILYINNNSINLNEYNDIKVLDINLVSFRDNIRKKLVVLLVKNK